MIKIMLKNKVVSQFYNCPTFINKETNKIYVFGLGDMHVEYNFESIKEEKNNLVVYLSTELSKEEILQEVWELR